LLAADRVCRPTNLDCLRQASAASKVQVAIRKRLGRIAWLPIGLIGLENAVERVVAAKYGAGSIAEWMPATLSGECEAQAYGGVRTLAWEEARAWILGHLQAGKLTWNREIIVPEQGIKSLDQGSFSPDQGRPSGSGQSAQDSTRASAGNTGSTSTGWAAQSKRSADYPSRSISARTSSTRLAGLLSRPGFGWKR
jgi:hypothetical protein